VADTSRIEELRRRVQKDPASIAFAQLAEEYRRAGWYKEAIDTCEAGLAHHPGYLSARVTLGRSFLETGELDAAQMELKQVLRAAPENLAALRGLAEIHHRRGELHEALAHYRTALEFARNDPELQHLVDQISKDLEPTAAPVVVDGLSFEEVKDAFLNLSLPEPAADQQSGAEGPEHADVPAESVDTPTDTPSVEEDTPPASVDVGQALPDTPSALADTVPGLPDNVSALADASSVSFPDLTPAEPETLVTPTATEPLDLALDEEAFAWPAPVATSEPATELPSLTELPTQPMTAASHAGATDSGQVQVETLERWLDAILAERQRRG
jgi:tetratricopeptide (TPR) repeat protein